MDGIFAGTSETAPSASSPSVLESVCAVLAPFNRSGVTLLPETKISEELEVDSVAIFDVIMDVEDTYNVTFPMEAIADIKTIGQLSDMIEELRAT